jgi:hypothetical protein
MGFPAGTRNPATISYRDAGNEIGTFRVYGADITPANLATQEALFTALVNAADAITLGARTKTTYISTTTTVNTQPINGAARELKLLVQYQDDVTGARWTTTLPTLDPTIPAYVININAKDVVQVTTPAAIAAFVTAFEDFAVDPIDNTNTVTVVGLKVVGRNN